MKTNETGAKAAQIDEKIARLDACRTALDARVLMAIRIRRFLPLPS